MNNLNLQAFNLNEDIRQIINSSDLDACIIYYTIKDIWLEIEKKYLEIVHKEYQM